MTYSEFLEKREALARLESEYLETWKNISDPRKRSKKLAKLSLELNRLQDEITSCRYYK